MKPLLVVQKASCMQVLARAGGEIQRPTGLRALQEEVLEAESAVTVVTTAQQFLRAKRDGARHIEVRDH
jgi:hypothetical protein